jgi:hypothetical protein
MQSDYNTKGVAARWRNIRRLYPVYLAISHSFQVGPKPPYASLANVTEEQEPEAIEHAENWMAQMDANIQPHHLRQVIQQTDVAATEPRLLALVQRHASKGNRSQLDSDKLNFVMTQYLWACAPPSFRSREISVLDAAEVLEPVLGSAPSEFAPWLKPVQELLQQLRLCDSVADLVQAGFVERGRELRSQLAARYFERSSLLLFAYYNFCLRQTFDRVIAEDAKRINKNLEVLDIAGETILRIPNRPVPMTVEEVRELVRQLTSRPPGEYGVDESWKQLPELRAAVERAIADSRSIRSTDERVEQLGDKLQRLLEQIDGVRTELAALREIGFSHRPAAKAATASGSSSDGFDMPLELDPPDPRPAAPRAHVAAPPVTSTVPAAAPAPVSNRVEALATEAASDGQRSAVDDAAVVATEMAKQLAHLRAVLSSAKSTTGLIPIGNTAIVLSATEIDTVLKGSDRPAELIRQGIAARMSLVEKLELAKMGQPQEFRPMRNAAYELQAAINTLLKDGSRRGPSDALSITTRQLAAVLRAVPRA